MPAVSAQPGLFDTAPALECNGGDAARARMTATIARLSAATSPPWADQLGVILEDGAFQRAMRLVPEDEAQVLWAVFDTEMERLSALLGPPLREG